MRLANSLAINLECLSQQWFRRCDVYAAEMKHPKIMHRRAGVRMFVTERLTHADEFLPLEWFRLHRVSAFEVQPAKVVRRQRHVRLLLPHRPSIDVERLSQQRHYWLALYAPPVR